MQDSAAIIFIITSYCRPLRIYKIPEHISLLLIQQVQVINEEHGTDGSSLQNEGELAIVQKLFETESLDPLKTAFISPYAGQVAAAKELLPKQLRISTIDSFQGQEKENIIVSLGTKQ